MAFNRRPLDPPRTVIGADKAAREYWSNLHEDLVALVPVGGMVGWDDALAVPDGWLRANGDLVSKMDYKRLYAIVGDTHGTGSAIAFKLPTRANFIVKY